MVLSALSGCALLVTDNSKALEAEAMKVGETVISKKEVVDLWTNFYNNYQYYFYSGMDHTQIVEAFYKSVVLRYATIQEVEKLIADGTLTYTQRDEASVWQSVFESYASSVDTIEKSLLTTKTDSEEYLPERLKEKSSSSSDEKKYQYSEYHFEGMDDYECENLATNYHGEPLASGYKVGKEIADADVRNMIDKFESKYLKIYAVDLEDDDKLADHYDTIDEYLELLNNPSYFKSIREEELETRTYAYNMLVGRLKLSAKNEGKNTDKSVVLFNQFKESYISAYETYLQNMYSSYVKSLVDKATSGKYYTLNDVAIVARYLQLLGKDIQSYALEENYIAVMEASQTDALLMYNFGGKNYYFTVQHLLVSFDGTITNGLAELRGSNSEASAEQYAAYDQARANYYAELGLADWTEYENVVYVDDNGYAVYSYTFEDDEHVYHTYDVFYGGAEKDYEAPVYEEDDETPEDDRLTAYYYLVADEKVYLTKGQFDTCTRAKVSVDEMLVVFNTTYSQTLSILNANYTREVEEIRELLKADANVHYVISDDFIDGYKALKAESADTTEFEYKIYANLFLQHAYKYSSNNNALESDLSGHIGMVLSSQADNNKASGSTYVSEFTNGARALLNRYLTDGTFSKNTIGEQNFIISDYGIHVVIINDVYQTTGDAPEAITGNNITFAEVFGTDDQAEIAAKAEIAANKMKEVYACTASSQTLYEYIYELIRDELVGSSGTTYTKARNELYNDYSANKVSYSCKLGYDELMDLM